MTNTPDPEAENPVIVQLEQAIAALEAQRSILSDTVVDTALAPLREKLASLQTPPPTQQRKQLTVLFADVSGFTALSETMDAEDVANTMNALWQVVDAAIVNHGGMIDKHIGDAVMALWGAQTAREDDPEQAVRAALAMQSALAEFRQHRNLKLAMRIGLNTGPVLVGTVGSNAEFTAMGDTVNLASRLEHAAPVGGILISAATYRSVRGLFEMQALEPLTVKGKVALIQTYLVYRIKPRTFHLRTRGIEGVKTRMVGRDAEFTQLTSTFRQAVATRHLHAATVLGEAGVGKSRLLYEFWDWIERQPEDVRLLHGRATQAMTQRPYTLLRDIFCFRFDIQDSDTAIAARDKLEQGIIATLGHDDPDALLKAHFIGQLIGLDFSSSPHLRGIRDDAKQIRDRALHYLSQFIGAMAHNAPLLFVLDDIHWADDASLDGFTHLMHTCHEWPIFFLCLSRRTILERRPGWSEDRRQLRIMLQPLTKTISRQLVQDILRHVANVPNELRELIVNGAEGNPFYVEELVKMLIDDGVIIPGAETWQIQEGRLAEVRVPPTLTALLQARLDGLPAVERDILQRASVLGRVFWDQAIVQLEDGDGAALMLHADAVSNLGLNELRRRDLVYQQDISAFAGSTEYFFKHVLLRDVTYETILKRQRRAYHAHAAEWLIGQSGERVAEYSGLIAEHFERAEQVDLAAQWYGQAGQQAQAAYANEEALHYYSKALALTEAWQWHKGRVEVLHILGRRNEEALALQALQATAEGTLAEVAMLVSQYYESIGNYPAASAAAANALHAYRAMHNPIGAAHSLAQLGLIARRTGAYEQAIDWYTQALNIFASEDTTLQGAQHIYAQALIGLGVVQRQLSQFAHAKASYEQALIVSRKSGNRKAEGDTLNGLGALAYHQRHLAEARSYYHQALTMRQAIGDRDGEGTSLFNLGVVAQDMGDYEQALATFAQALAIQQATGNRWEEVNVLMALGVLYQELGHLDQAQTYLQGGLVISHEIGDEAGEAYVLSNLGLVVRDQGNLEQAEHLLTRGMELIHTQDDLAQEAFFLSYLSTISLRAGQFDQAVERAQAALQLRRQLGLFVRTTAELTTLAETYLARGDVTRALNHAHQAYTILQGCGSEGPEAPHHDYYVCSKVFAASGEAGLADQARHAAYTLVMERAANITDPDLRQSFLNNVPINRAIIDALSERQQGS